MKHYFTITYKNQIIQVESEQTNTFNLKYPDFKYLMLDRNPEGWAVEDRSGDYWTDEDINAIGLLIDKHQPVNAADSDFARREAE